MIYTSYAYYVSKKPRRNSVQNLLAIETNKSCNSYHIFNILIPRLFSPVMLLMWVAGINSGVMGGMILLGNIGGACLGLFIAVSIQEYILLFPSMD